MPDWAQVIIGYGLFMALPVGIMTAATDRYTWIAFAGGCLIGVAQLVALRFRKNNNGTATE